MSKSRKVERIRAYRKAIGRIKTNGPRKCRRWPVALRTKSQRSSSTKPDTEIGISISQDTVTPLAEMLMLLNDRLSHLGSVASSIDSDLCINTRQIHDTFQNMLCVQHDSPTIDAGLLNSSKEKNAPSLAAEDTPVSCKSPQTISQLERRRARRKFRLRPTYSTAYVTCEEDAIDYLQSLFVKEAIKLGERNRKLRYFIFCTIIVSLVFLYFELLFLISLIKP